MSGHNGQRQGPGSVPPAGSPQRPLSPGLRCEEPSEREKVELAGKGQNPDDYISIEVGCAALNIGMEADGCLVGVLVIRLPPGAALDIKAPKLVGTGPQTDHLGLQNTSMCMRLTVKKTAVTKPIREGYPEFFPEPEKEEEPLEFAVMGGDSQAETVKTVADMPDPEPPPPRMPGGLLGALLRDEEN